VRISNYRRLLPVVLLALWLDGCWRGSWGTPGNSPSEHAFKPGDKLHSTNRTPCTFGAPKGSKGLISVLQEQVRKAGHAIEHGTDCHQTIIFPRHMGSYARPRPIRRIPGQAGSHRIQADVGDRRQQSGKGEKGGSALGLPIGLQIAGAPFAESTVLALANAYECETAWHTRRHPA
jgi:hypothetical protein